MARYEVKIKILDPRHVDRLITALVRQGYAVYFNGEEDRHGIVCFTASDDDLYKLKDRDE